MVNVEKTPFGGHAYIIDGSAGNNVGYGHRSWHIAATSPGLYRQHYHPATTISNEKRKHTYHARQLHTTNLATEHKQWPAVSTLSYVAHGQVHQGQFRPRGLPAYNFPSLIDRSSTSQSSKSIGDDSVSSTKHNQKSSTNEKTDIRVKPFVLPEIARRTAGMSTLATVSHPGFAKAYAASRADGGSLVNALRSGEHIVTGGEVQSQRIGSTPDSDWHLGLVPHGLEISYYSDLENLKKQRLCETYLGIMKNHKRQRSRIVRQKIQRAERVREGNLHADQSTAILLGIRNEPIRIPTAQMDDDYYIEHGDRPKKLRAVEQARKNISRSYLNVWNLKKRNNKSNEE